MKKWIFCLAVFLSLNCVHAYDYQDTIRPFDISHPAAGLVLSDQVYSDYTTEESYNPPQYLYPGGPEIKQKITHTVLTSATYKGYFAVESGTKYFLDKTGLFYSDVAKVKEWLPEGYLDGEPDPGNPDVHNSHYGGQDAVGVYGPFTPSLFAAQDLADKSWGWDDNLITYGWVTTSAPEDAEVVARKRWERDVIANIKSFWRAQLWKGKKVMGPAGNYTRMIELSTRSFTVQPNSGIFIPFYPIKGPDGVSYNMLEGYVFNESPDFPLFRMAMGGPTVTYEVTREFPMVTAYTADLHGFLPVNLGAVPDPRADFVVIDGESVSLAASGGSFKFPRDVAQTKLIFSIHLLIQANLDDIITKNDFNPMAKKGAIMTKRFSNNSSERAKMNAQFVTPNPGAIDLSNVDLSYTRTDDARTLMPDAPAPLSPFQSGNL